MIRHVLVGLIVFTASTASAGVIGFTRSNTNFTTPDASLTSVVPRHTGYELLLATDDGSLIQAIDVSITGRLHQRWVVIDLDTFEFTPTPVGTSVTNGDSHLTPIAGALIAIAPDENNVSQSPVPDTATRDYGYGTSMRGAWGIPGASQTTFASIGYIVVPDSDGPNVSVNVRVATTSGVFTPSGFSPLPSLTSQPIIGPGIELNFGSILGNPNPAPLPIALSNTGGGVININSIALAGPDAAYFTLVGQLPTTLTGFLPAQQFGIKPITPLPFGTGNLEAVVQVRTDWGNLDFDVFLEVPEPSALLISTIAIAGLAVRIRR